MAQTRREFLVRGGCGALSASALLSGLGRFALIDALAQAPQAGYQALVCVFLFGGNDANNMLIPYTNYSDYGSVRMSGRDQFAVPQSALTATQINPPSASGLTFALHPKLAESFSTNPSLLSLWNQGSAAIVCNTGPLVTPLTRDQYRNPDPTHQYPHPYQLFSHSDQQNLWQTSYATRPRQAGWGGLTVDNTGGSGGNFPAIASLSGVTVFSTGQNTRPLVLASAPTPLNATLKLFKGSDQALLDALTADGQDPMPALVQGAAQITTSALAASDALSTDPTNIRAFPSTPLGNQLKQVAKLISLNGPLGVNRQVFFAALGGFDTHTGQGAYNTNNGQAGLLGQLSQAIGTFYQAMVDLGLSNQVTLFTSSDFSRTFVPGGGNTGTDHAWGSHQFVVGDAVAGGDFYGQYPPLLLGDGQDTDAGSGARGRWIPTTSVDQYAATLAAWYGLDLSQFGNNVFPNLQNFPGTLGFFRGAGPARKRTRAARA